MTPEQEALVERVAAEMLSAGAGDNVFCGILARAIIPLIWNAATAAERERCLAAVQREIDNPAHNLSPNLRMGLRTAQAAIRALPSMEADDGR
jgi:hypothetical protein